MCFRPSLTPGAPNRAVEKGHKETPVRRSPQIPDAMPAPPLSTSAPSYPLCSTPAVSTSSSAGGKMKKERSVRPSLKRVQDEAPGVPDLPAISLPISNFTLPTFSFSASTSSLPPSSASVTPVPTQPALTKESPRVSTPDCVPFIFSSPIVKATAASPPSFSPSSGFTFSAPTMKTAPAAANGKLVSRGEAVKVAPGEGKEEFEGPFKPAKVLKSGSVLDILKGPGFASAQTSSVPDRTTQTAVSARGSPPLPGSGFGDKFKPAAGSWNCDTCLLLNKPSDKKCVACQSLQPNTDSSSKLDSKPAKSPAASLPSLFAPPAGSWECDTCLVQNKAEVVKCVACDTAKPGTGVKPALTLAPASESPSTLCTTPAPSASATSASTTSGLLGFGDKFKKPEGAWNCDVCMVENKAQDVKCVACQSAKPGAAAVASTSLPSGSTPANPAPLLGFGDKFKKPEGSWDCDVCCVQNKAEDKQCVACQSAKPGTKVESKGFGSSSSTESSTSGFKFGTSSSNSTSDGLKFGGTFSDSTTVSFKFGNASSDSTLGSAGFKFGGSSADCSVGFKFGGASTEFTSTGTSSSAGFKFGNSSDSTDFVAAPIPVSTSEEKKNESLNSGTGFKFGGSSGITFGSAGASTATTSGSTGFSFGLPKPEEKAGSTLAFSFSTPKAKTEKDDAPSTDAVAATTTTTALANTIPVFGKIPAAESAPSLGETATKESTLATTTFTFGKPEEKTDSSVPSSGFLFSAAKEADKPTPSLGFSFSKPDPPKDLPKSTFTFGKPTELTEAPKPAFGFGQNAADNATQKPTFGFMANSSSTPASSSSAPSLFGNSSNSTLAPTPAPTNTFIFGQNSSSSDAPPAKTFLFGQQQESQPASTAPPAAPPAAPAPAQPFIFGSATNSTTPAFAFGAAAAATPASAAPPLSAAPSPFTFTSATSSSGFGSGQTTIFGQGSSQPSAPAFGSAAPSFTATPSPAPAFGAKPTTAAVFGQQANATPAFGSSTASTGQGGFPFGGASAFGASASSSGVFTFGAGSGAAAASPAAPPAMTTQSPAPGGGFSFSQPPAFNIGSAKSSFNATSTGQHSIAGRKIKTAVRRRK